MENLKDKIVQILLDSSQQYGDTYEQRCIYDSDFNDVAELVVNIITQKPSDTLLTEIMVLREKNAELLQFIKDHYRYLNLDDQDKAELLINSNIT